MTIVADGPRSPTERGQGRDLARCPTTRGLGLDCVRVASIGLVATMHILSITGLEAHPSFGGLLHGRQMGVTVLCAISGYLAARRDDARTPLRWLQQRLARVVPSYWIILTGILIANAWYRYKPIDAAQMMSQYLGTGLLTHPGSLVGVHTWFLTLILICYGMGAAVRWRIGLLPVLLIAAHALVPRYAQLAIHAESFLIGMAIGLVPRWRGAALSLGLSGLGLSVTVAPHLTFPAVGALGIAASHLISAPSPRPLRLIAVHTYEFYLIHGPVYLALWKLLGWPAAALAAVGTPLAAGLAIAVGWTAARIRRWLRAYEMPWARVVSVEPAAQASA